MSIANPAFRPEPSFGFDHAKAVQMIAHFVRKQGGRADKLKLIKLIYLAERLSFERRGRPMNFDSYFSLPHGPVASSALDGMDQKLSAGEWASIALAENKKDVTIVGEVLADRLSRADVAILEATWDQFGKLSASQLRNWTHDHCAEYTEVELGSRVPIDVSDILSEVGASHIDTIARDLRMLQKEVGRLERLRASS